MKPYWLVTKPYKVRIRFKGLFWHDSDYDFELCNDCGKEMMDEFIKTKGEN
jgi:hypothetical protein